MMQIKFIEFNEKSGIGDLLFVNMGQSTVYRFYRRRDSWDECYMVEFCSNSEDYHFYWGHNEQERGMEQGDGYLFHRKTKSVIINS